MSYWITTEAAIKYHMLAEQSGTREVGGYAKFHIDQHKNHVVTDLRAIRQESTEVYFEISAKENGLFLEQLVAEGEDPADWSMLFHTHPEGMDAHMSGTDIKQLTEMATDLSGSIARSMILGQGMMKPMIHEAISVEGRVFLRESTRMKLLDTTGATDMLKQIGFFDKPKVVKQTGFGTGRHVAHRNGYTASYAAGVERGRSTELVPAKGGLIDPANNDGWFDESPLASESGLGNIIDGGLWGGHSLDSIDPTDTAAYSQWLDEKYSITATGGLEEEAKDDLKDEADDYIDEMVQYNGVWMKVMDAYIWEGEIVLVLPNNAEVKLDEVTQAEEQSA